MDHQQKGATLFGKFPDVVVNKDRQNKMDKKNKNRGSTEKNRRGTKPREDVKNRNKS